jgi:hypothetical protein
MPKPDPELTVARLDLGLPYAIRPAQMLASMKVLLRRARRPWSEPEDCTFVVSFPKSGRTWHRLMLGYYLARASGAPASSAFKVGRMCRRAGIKPVHYSHNDAGFKDGLSPSSRLVASPRLWKRRDVLFLVRNPRDVLVSAYHHATLRSSTRFHGSISQFIRKPETGIAKVMKAYNAWYENRELAASYRIHSYEEMHCDPAAVLTSSLEFFGLPAVDPCLVDEAVEFCRFENMQRYERLDLFGVKQLRNERGEAPAAKVREGRVGSHATALSADDLAFIEAHIASVGDPFARYYQVSS